MRLLLAEDDPILGSAVKTFLCRAGLAVDLVTNTGDFQEAWMTHQYDFVVLGLTEKNGEDLLHRLRKYHPRMPTIIVTSECSPYTKVKMLNLGADDILLKPFNLDELAARIRAIIRRLPAGDANDGASSHGPLCLIPLRYAATWNGEPIPLTHREYWVLELFVRRKNQILTRPQIEESLYGWGSEVESNTVEVYIHLLRRKFGPSLIHTIRGVGYQLAPALAGAGKERQGFTANN